MPSFFSRFLALVVVAVGGSMAGTALPAQTEAPGTGIELTSDAPIEYDDRTGQMVARQNARLSYDGWLLIADEIRYSQSGGKAEASGHVVVMKEGYRLVADRVEYWPKEKKAELTRFRLGQPPFYVAGDHAGGMVDDISMEEPQLFYGEPDSLAPRATADSIQYFGGNRFKAERLVVRLGAVPVFFAPGISGDLDIGDQYLEGYGGYSSDLGAFAGFGIAVGVGPQLDLGGSLGYFSNRGLLWGPIVRYRPKRGEEGATGDFRLYAIDDSEPGVDALGTPIDPDRYFVTWDHLQQVGENFRLTALLNAWSDSNVTRDFRPGLFNESQQPDTYAEAVYRGSNFVVNVFGRVQVNDFFPMTERLPEVRFDLMPTRLPGGFINEAQLSAAHLSYTDRTGNRTLKSERLDVYYGLSRAIRATNFLTLTPVAGGRVTYYGDTVDDSGSYTRVLGEVGLDAEIHGFGKFDFKDEIWEINGLRHLINTKFQYRYIPDAEKGKSIIPVIDRDVFSTSMPPIALNEIRPVLDDLFATNVLRIGFDNIIQTRHKEYGSRDLLSLYLAGDIRFDGDGGDERLSSIFAAFALTPASWLRAGLFARFDTDNLDLQELNTEIWLIDLEFWNLGIGTDFLKNQFQQYTLESRFRVNDTFSLNLGIRYDDKTSILTEGTIMIAQNIRDLWQIEYGITFFDGNRRETGNRLEFGLRFLGF